MGAEKLAPFKPRGAEELKNLPAKTSKEEGLFLVSEMFDLFAVEIDWKYGDPALTGLFKNAKSACLTPISKFPPAYFAEDAKTVYVDRDFNKGTSRTVEACANYVQQSLNSTSGKSKLEGKLRKALPIEDLMALQQNAEFMKRLKQEYPENIFTKYSFAPLAAGKNLPSGGAAVALPMGGVPVSEEPLVRDGKDIVSSKAMLIAFGMSLLIVFILAILYKARSSKQRPKR